MNVLVCGMGKIARTHLNALRSIEPDCKVFALRSSKNSPRHADVTDILSLDELPVRPDFAIISNPTGLHADTILKLLPLRVPLFIEKPLFHTLLRREVLDAIEEAGVMTYVACNLRFLDSVNFVREYIRANPERRINEVNVYCGTNLRRYREDTDYRRTFNALPEEGGGIHIDMIHDIDYVCHIFGFPDRGTAVFRNVSSLGIEASDYANYILEYPGFTASVILDYYRPVPKRTLEIVFDDEIMTVDFRANVIRNGNDELIYRSANTVADTYTDQMKAFVEAVRNGNAMDYDARRAFEVMKVAHLDFGS